MIVKSKKRFKQDTYMNGAGNSKWNLMQKECHVLNIGKGVMNIVYHQNLSQILQQLNQFLI